MALLAHLPKIKNTDSGNFFLIAGPCLIEGEQMAIDIAGKVSELCAKYRIPYIFKGSFVKANRSRIDSFSTIGHETALEVLRKVGDMYDIPVTTDIHTEEQAALAAQYVDVLQIPAFLARQTELLVAAAVTGKFVNIKKGQFMSPESMEHAVIKIRQSGNDKIWLTDRGTMFGYQDLIVDYRGIPAMQKFDVPVVLDCTHSLQQPNQTSGVTGGKPELIETIAKAGVAVGVDGLFMETHPTPLIAKSDGANMLPLDKLSTLLEKLLKISEAIR